MQYKPNTPFRKKKQQYDDGNLLKLHLFFSYYSMIISITRDKSIITPEAVDLEI